MIVFGNYDAYETFINILNDKIEKSGYFDICFLYSLVGESLISAYKYRDMGWVDTNGFELIQINNRPWTLGCKIPWDNMVDISDKIEERKCRNN